MKDRLGTPLAGFVAAATAALALALGAAPALAAEGCPNEVARQASDVGPSGQPYSLGLPECRGYEMVSPLEKQAHDAIPYAALGYPVAPDGEVAGFVSEGGFADPANFRVNLTPANPYLARREEAGWSTTSAFAPAELVSSPFLNGLDSDFSPDLTGAHVSCGVDFSNNNGALGDVVACAALQPDGTWASTPLYASTNGSAQGDGTEGYLGASADLGHLLIQPEIDLLPADTVDAGSTGIYEITGIGTDPKLRLVNVDNSGKELSNGSAGPLLGDSRQGPNVAGTAYHAISESGETVFFTATPAAGVQTVFARLKASETLAVSNPSPSQCALCSQTPRAATYQGASRDGSKVFFTTAQQLVDADTDSSTDLYEYDFDAPAGHNLIELSAGDASDPTPGTGAEVQGVVRTSSDGSHVYFVAKGVLTTAANNLGQSAVAHAENLYAVDTENMETKFIAELCTGTGLSGPVADASCPTASTDSALWGGGTSQDANSRLAQSTPDGRYLVFDTFAQLSAEDTNAAQAVYRYDFQTGQLAWVSHASPGFAAADEGSDAIVAALPGTTNGAEADIDDWNRAISENGQYIVFTTAERLQANDANGGSSASSCSMAKFVAATSETAGCDVYEWHDGTVSMISDGQDPDGAGAPVISASGADIFFFTHTQLVGQDTDLLQDLYDARIDGGLPAPTPEPSCHGEACQGPQSPAPPHQPGATESFTASGNPQASTAFPSPTAIGKVRILKRLAKDSHIFLSIHTPAKGRVSISGSGVRAARRSAAKAGRYTIKLTLTPPEKRRLNRKRKVTLKLKVAFLPASNASGVSDRRSTATTTMTISKSK